MNEATNQQLTLQQLPDDCLWEIFGYVGFIDKLVMAKLDARFKDVIVDMWRKKYRTFKLDLWLTENFLLQTAEMKEFFKLIMPVVQTLCLSDTHGISYLSHLGRYGGPDLNFFLSHDFPMLETLDNENSTFHEAHLQRIASNCPILKKLITHTVNAVQVDLRRMPRLKTLKLSTRKFYMDEVAVAFSFDWHVWPEVNNDSHQNLEHLQFVLPQLEQMVQGLKGMLEPAVTEFTLLLRKETCSTEFKPLEFLANMPAVQKLTVDLNKPLDTSNFPPFFGLPALREMHILNKSFDVVARSLLHVIVKSRNLEVIYFEPFTTETDWSNFSDWIKRLFMFATLIHHKRPLLIKCQCISQEAPTAIISKLKTFEKNETMQILKMEMIEPLPERCTIDAELEKENNACVVKLKLDESLFPE